MKTAVYIPDNIFALAEKIAHQLKVTRSEFYARAIEEYLKDKKEENVTQQLNALYEDQTNPSVMDKGLYQAQLKIVQKEEW